MSPLALALVLLPTLQTAAPDEPRGEELEYGFVQHDRGASRSDGDDDGYDDDGYDDDAYDDDAYDDDAYDDEAYQNDGYDNEDYERIDVTTLRDEPAGPSAGSLGIGATLGGIGAATGAMAGVCAAAGPACVLGLFTQGWGTLVAFPFIPWCGAMGAAIGGTVALFADFSLMTFAQVAAPFVAALGMGVLAAVTAVTMGFAVGIGASSLVGGLAAGFAILMVMSVLTAIVAGGVHMAIGFGRMAFAEADVGSDVRRHGNSGKRRRYTSLSNGVASRVTSQAAPTRAQPEMAF